MNIKFSNNNCWMNYKITYKILVNNMIQFKNNTKINSQLYNQTQIFHINQNNKSHQE